MLVPLQDHFLLLPNPTIAEVIPMPKLTIVDSTPVHFIGQYDWKNKAVPVVDLEHILDNTSVYSRTAPKLCILHGINAQAQIEFYALPCFGAPQLITLNEHALQQTHDLDDSSFLYCQIKIGNKVAFIPHLDNIELTLAGQTP
jgi:chemosensory pili system protein ChpC